LFTGTSSSGQDFATQFEALRRLDADGRDRSDVLAYVLKIEHRHASPDARMRKQIVEVWASLRAPRVGMAVVTTSMLHRGAITVTNWFVPESAARMIHAFLEFDDAVRWIESLRGRPLPELEALLTHAQREAARGAPEQAG
jgi:hypothetical protein